MDIKLPHSTLTKYLETDATPEQIAQSLTLCGPSVDRLHKVDNDYLYEIEAITNRVDSASAFGVAREACAILPLFGFKASLKNNPYQGLNHPYTSLDIERNKLNVQIIDPELVPRFAAVVVSNLKVGESPKSIQQQLTLAGERPINNLVDITNYLTLCLGQPVHIFDYDKIGKQTMILRESKKGEKVTTLDGKTHILKGEDIVIEDGDGSLIDLCGIMGAKNSEVDETTKTGVLFVQTYHPKKIRRTSLYTQERTLAAQIFEKQPDPELVKPTLLEGLKLLQELASAEQTSNIIDLYHLQPTLKTISLDFNWLNKIIGVKIEPQKVQEILNNLGFATQNSSNELVVTVPSFRAHDITIPEDLAEEVARVYGYFRLDGTLPNIANAPKNDNQLLKWEYETKKYLADLGFTEIFNYSLVSQSLFNKAEMEIGDSIQLSNPLTEDFEYMRRSLIPSLLSNLSENLGKTNPPLHIFELANIYLATDENQLPIETPVLVMAILGDDYRKAKGYLEALFNQLKIPEIYFKKLNHGDGPWSANQTAQVYSGQHFLGVFGPIKPNIKTNFGLNQHEVIFANLDFLTLSNLSNRNHVFRPISPYPDIIEDLTIESTQTIGEIITHIRKISPLITQVIYQTSFQNKHTFTLHFNDQNKNLTKDEVEQIKSKLLKS